MDLVAHGNALLIRFLTQRNITTWSCWDYDNNFNDVICPTRMENTPITDMKSQQEIANTIMILAANVASRRRNNTKSSYQNTEVIL